MARFSNNSNYWMNTSLEWWNSFETAPNPHFYHQITIMDTTPVPALTGPFPDLVPSTASTDETETGIELRLPIWGICIMVIGYSCVFIFGLIGNCSVLIVVFRLNRMKTVTNLFICNLAIADLLVLLFCLLPNLISNIFIPWILGWWMCKTVPYVQGVSVCASVYSLCANSLERCISIQWPFQYQITKARAKKIMVGIWLWSCAVALPWGLFFDTYKADVQRPNDYFCIEKWPESYDSWSRYYFLIGNFVICYVLPLGIIFVCYLTIWFRVYRRPVPTDSNHKSMEIMHQKAKAAVMKMLLVVVLIFTLSWLPLYCIIIRLKFGNSLSESEHEIISIVFPAAQWLGSFNSGINPLVYSFLNKNFRHGFRMIFKCSLQSQDGLPPLRANHKSPTVNILLQRMAVYRVKTSSIYRDTEDV